MKKIPGLLLLLSLSTPAIAALNKWVDSEGKVHYSDSAPPDAKVTKVKISNQETEESADSRPKSLAEKEVDAKKAQQEKEKEDKKAAQEKENEQIKQKNCEGARSNLINLENSPVIATYNEKGERSIMDDNSRKQRIEEARQAVSRFCN